MKYVMLLLLCLLLSGCGQQRPEIVLPPPREPEPEAASPEIPQPEEAPYDVVDMEIRYAPRWEGSELQQGPPVVPQPGETGERWNWNRTRDYPADAACSPRQLLEKWMAVEGLTGEDLDSRACDQLVLVSATGDREATAVFTCYERRETGEWEAVEGLTDLWGYTGSGGIAHNRRRSTRQSPAGLWALGSAFGLREPPEDLQLPWRQITDQSDWVGDADSPYFNTWQERDDPAVEPTWDREDSEHLADFDQTYTYAVVVQFNTPPYAVPDRGFAIFFHVSDHPTSGCIALEEDDFLQVLSWLNPHKNPHVLITGSPMG